MRNIIAQSTYYSSLPPVPIGSETLMRFEKRLHMRSPVASSFSEGYSIYSKNNSKYILSIADSGLGISRLDISTITRALLAFNENMTYQEREIGFSHIVRKEF